MQEEKCKNALENVCHKIERKYGKWKYFKDGGADKYFADIKNAKEIYKGLTNLGPAVFLYIH